MLTNLFLRGRIRETLSSQELAALESAAAEIKTIGPRTTLVEKGECLDSSYYLVDGIALRHLSDRRGRRQLVQVNIPGDFIDLHSYPMKRLDHSIETLKEVRIARFPHQRISEIVADFPNLARALWFSTLLDAAMHREWIFRLGRLNAEGRIAHLICELIARLRIVDLYDGEQLHVPLLQRDYAESCGISAVHANRSFRVLKERGLLSLGEDGSLTIFDEPALCRLAEFDPAYLYAEGDLALHAYDC